MFVLSCNLNKKTNRHKANSNSRQYFERIKYRLDDILDDST